jgi:hypothetical protein
MAISGTYGGMQSQIADELGDRTDLLLPLSGSGLTLSPIQNAIQSAIALWEREPFYFNEAYDQNLFSTVSGTELYTTSGDTGNTLANAAKIIRLHVLISGNRYPLNARTWQYLEDTSANPSVTGQPVDYAYLAETLRLYPIPDGAYPITMTVTARFTALSASSDANAWTQDAYDLIRSQAKLILGREVLNDDDLVTRMEMAIYGASSAGGSFARIPQQRGYLAALKNESTRRARSRISPSYF